MSQLSFTPDVDMIGPGGGINVWIFGVLVTIKALANETGGDYSLLESVVYPGDGPPSHTHTQEDETWYVLEGEFTFIVGEKTFHATEGCFIHLPRNVQHTFINESDKIARMVFTFSPGGFGEWFAKIGEPVADRNAPGDPPPLTEDYVTKALSLASEEYGIVFPDRHESKDEL